MKQLELTSDEKAIQKVLNQLISEEWMASVMYRQFILAACCCEQRKNIKDLLLELSDDEMDDHYAKLVKYAVNNGYSVPCKIKEYEKYASEATTKQFNNWKKDKDAGYYADEALKAETEAIHSYETVMANNVIPDDLMQILVPNYYDELEHFDKLRSLQIVYNSGLDYVYNGY